MLEPHIVDKLSQLDEIQQSLERILVLTDEANIIEVDEDDSPLSTPQKIVKPLFKDFIQELKANFPPTSTLNRNTTLSKSLDVGESEALLEELAVLDTWLDRVNLYTQQKTTQPNIPDSIMKQTYFKNSLDKWSDKIKSSFYSNISQYFVTPSSSAMKPFISDQTIEKILSDPLSQLSLVEGDVIHVPFTTLENNIIKEEFEAPDSTITINNQLLKVLHGRTESDIIRYIEGALLKSMPGHTFDTNNIVVYKPKRSLRKENRISSLLQMRDHSLSIKKSSLAVERDFQKSIFVEFQCVSRSTLPGGPIIECKFHPFENKLAVCTNTADDTNHDNIAILYDLKERNHVILNGHTKDVSQINFSIRGDFLITSSFDKTIKVWSSTNGVLCGTFGTWDQERKTGHDDEINIMALHSNPDSYLFATSALDRTVVVWNLLERKCVYQLSNESKSWTGPLNGMTFGKNSYQDILIGVTDNKPSKPGEILLWNLISGKLDCKMQRIHNSPINCVSTSTSGELIATGGCDNTVKLIDMKTQRIVNSFSVKGQDDINWISFSECDRFVQSCGTENRSIVYDTRFSSKPLHILSHQSVPSANNSQGVTLGIWTKSTFLVTAGEDATVRVWDIRSGNPLVKVLSDHQKQISGLAVSPMDDLIASGADDCAINLYSHRGNTSLGLNMDII